MQDIAKQQKCIIDHNYYDQYFLATRMFISNFTVVTWFHKLLVTLLNFDIHVSPYQAITEPCTTLHHCTTMYNSVQLCMMLYNSIQLCTTTYNSLGCCKTQYDTVHLNFVLHCTTLYKCVPRVQLYTTVNYFVKLGTMLYNSV